MKAPPPSVSVCVPVFNTEGFLPRCLDSLLGQTLRELEIVIVNDGSSDGSQTIIDEYCRKDPRIVHAFQPNQGPGATRNAGLRMASGDYIAFLDSDDWAEPDWLELLYSEARTSGADLVVCDYVIHFPESSRRQPVVFRNPFVSGEKDKYLNAILERSVAGFSWNKLYRRRLVVENGFRFPTREEFQNVEDQYYSLRAVQAAGAIAFVHRPLVHYRIHSSSIVHKYQATLFHDQVELFKRNLAFLSERMPTSCAPRALEASFLKGVFACTLNECKETNRKPLRARVAAVRAMGRDPLFRAIYDKSEPRLSLPLKVRAVLAPVRWGMPFLPYVVARAYKWLIDRKTS